MLWRGMKHRALLGYVYRISANTLLFRSCSFHYSNSSVLIETGKRGLMLSSQSLVSKKIRNGDVDEITERNAILMNITIGILLAVGFMVYYILWRFRVYRFERTLQAIDEPLDWEDFVHKLLSKDLVKKLNYQPHFCIVDVYLKLSQEEIEEKRRQDTHFVIHRLPEHVLKPDARFWFGGSVDELKSSVENALLDCGLTENVELYVDSFPDKVEIVYMIGILLFCLVFIATTFKRRGVRKKWS